MPLATAHDDTARTSFGAWLLKRRTGTGAIAQLGRIAATDRAFPRDGSADDVRKHLNAVQADPMLFDVVDDAETDWMCI